MIWFYQTYLNIACYLSLFELETKSQKLYNREYKKFSEVTKLEKIASTREDRRKVQKLKDRMSNNQIIKKSNKIKDLSAKVRRSLRSKTKCLDDDELFALLVVSLSNEIEILKKKKRKSKRVKKLQKAASIIIKKQIKRSKKKNISTPVLDCFDKKGNVIPDKITDLENEISNFGSCNNAEIMISFCFIPCE